MFSKVANIFQHAVDALSSNQPQRQQDFIEHWKSITHFFLKKKDHRVAIDQTNIPGHLDEMLRLLQEEEAGDDGMGSCMEYMLQHRILDTLYTLARTDVPPGMKPQVLRFFMCLLTRTSQPLLPHVNVHKAMLRLVGLCGETQASPTETDEIQFLCTLCATLKGTPYLVNFFIQSPESKLSAKAATQNMPASQSQASSQTITSSPKCSFTLVDSLLNLMHSPDARVAVKACEGLMLISSLPELTCANAMVKHTEFCQQLTSQLCRLYKKLPTVMDPADIEGVEAKWGLDLQSEAEDRFNFPGKRALTSFMSWLDFCDQLIHISHPVVAKSLARHIKEHFFRAKLEPAVLQASEAGSITATSLLSHCVRLVYSQPLLEDLIDFTLGEEDPAEGNHSTPQLKSRLIERCDHLSEELSITTLNLVGTMLHKPHKNIVQSLLLNNLAGRTYLAVTNEQQSAVDNKHTITESEQTKEESIKDGESLPNRLDSASEPASSETTEVGAPATTAEEQNLSTNSTTPAEITKTEKDSEDDSVISDHVNQDVTLGDKDDVKQEAQTTDSDQTVSNTQENGADQDSALGTSSEQSPAGGSEDPESPTKTSDVSLELPPGVSTGPEDLLEGSTDSPVNSVVAAPSGGDSSPMTDSLWRQDSADKESDASIQSSPGSSPTAPADSDNIHKVINFFLLLLPEWAKSSQQMGDSGYDTYLRDAHRQHRDVHNQCQGFDWPQSHQEEPVASEESYTEAAFLKVLLDKLSGLLDQSYEVNLHVTSLLASLAMLPHPSINDLMLDPFIKVKDGCRTLPQVLSKVVQDLHTRLKPSQDLSKRLVLVRKQLIGFSNNIRSRKTKRRFEDSQTLEGVIILEEFCKELAAIAFVKHHAKATM